MEESNSTKDERRRKKVQWNSFWGIIFSLYIRGIKKWATIQNTEKQQLKLKMDIISTI